MSDSPPMSTEPIEAGQVWVDCDGIAWTIDDVIDNPPVVTLSRTVFHAEAQHMLRSTYTHDPEDHG